MDIRTVVLEASSDSVLPTNLLVHSSVLSPVVLLIPGTTSGMVI